MFKKILILTLFLATMAFSTQFKGYYISLTFDDGPKLSFNPAFPDLPPSGGTDKVLDALLALNSRPGVVCGKNPAQFGVLPCAPGVGCGKVCGTISRVKVTFYVNGGNNTLMEGDHNHPRNSSPLMKRILAEGHEIANHTTTHLLQPTSSHAAIRTEIETTELRINQAILFDLEATRAKVEGDWQITPNTAVYSEFTDFFGRTYSMDNRFRSHSFRPNEFTMGPGFTGIDRDFFGPGEHLPWIFAGLDVDDWRGHTAEQMAHYILYGNAPCSSCPIWCSIGSTGIQFPGVMKERGAADGGIVLLHDGTKSFQAAVDLLPLIVPQLQELGYHFVAMENMFKFMDSEPEFIPANPKAGKGDGTRVNDWVIRGNTPILPECPPHNFPTGCETTCSRAGCEVKSPKCGLESCANCRTVSISNLNRSNDNYGIKFAINPVSDKAEISVVLPGMRATEAVAPTVVIYDMTGNVVFECRGDCPRSPANNSRPVVWDLRNQNGRFVANGTYLVVAEARDRNGRVYRYSARLGVKR